METQTGQRISPSSRPKHRMMQLASLKEDQEELIKRDVQEIKYALSPSSIIRNAVKSFNNDDEFRNDAVRKTIGIGANLLIDTLVFRKGFGIKKMLLDTGLKKLVNYFIARKKDASE